MKVSKVILTILVLILFTMNNVAQTTKMMTLNFDASKNGSQRIWKDSSGIHVFAKWKVKEGNLENVLNILKIVQDESIKESGNLFYQVYKSKSISNTIILFEAYSDKNALETHKKSLYYQEFVTKQILPLLEDREVIITTQVYL